MKPTLAALAVTALCWGALACGSSHNDVRTSTVAESSTTTTSGARAANGFGLAINDADDADDWSTRNTKGEKTDDEEVDHYAHLASPVDKRTVTAFATRYIRAAAAEDGVAACAMLVPSLAEGVPAEFGKARSGLPYMHGSTCAAVVSGLFKHFHRQFVTEAARLKVTTVRVAGRTAFALLAFRGLHERRYMGWERSGKEWKLEALRDSEFP
ncbi:MAG: hypothetical protein ACRDJ3_01060 [Solirubrobacteraceae bacterium]